MVSAITVSQSLFHVWNMHSEEYYHFTFHSNFYKLSFSIIYNWNPSADHWELHLLPSCSMSIEFLECLSVETFLLNCYSWGVVFSASTISMICIYCAGQLHSTVLKRLYSFLQEVPTRTSLTRRFLLPTQWIVNSSICNVTNNIWMDTYKNLWLSATMW